MRIAILLAGLLIWDVVTSENEQSALERSGQALMNFGPVRDLVSYAEDGALVEDVQSLTALVSSEAAAAVAARNVVEAERAERRAARERRREQLRLAPEDVDAIAKAVTELYREEEERAAEASAPQAMAAPAQPPAPEPEIVERSVVSLGPDILGAIVDASKKTGANSGYLLHIALRESGLALGAQAPTSSATGPFQFIQQTWYQMLGTYGPKHGLKAEAALLKKAANGTYAPVSAAARTEVLALRTDPSVAALMAGELTMENAKSMERLLGRSPAHGELYAAHVFGPAGAAKLVRTRDTAAATSAASILPSAAAANRWLFYTSGGTARSVASLFDELSRFMSTREVAQVCNANLNFLGV
ncbi:hypothetical protein [Parvibaculum lavamentivorans]|nr:hypothetical protein [Parvibaculum lavamentivorans]